MLKVGFCCFDIPSHILAVWIENEINLLVILNNLITVILMYFTICIGMLTEIIVLIVYMDNQFMIVTV